MANVEKKRIYYGSDGAIVLEVENGADAKNVDIDFIDGLEAKNAQAAFAEIAERVTELEADSGEGDGSTPSPDSGAASVSYNNSSSGLSSTNVQDAIDELAANAEHELATSQLSPVQVWSDDFSFDKTVSVYINSATSVLMSPRTIDAYLFAGTSINRDNILSAYVPFTKSGDKMTLNQLYTADIRETVWLVELVSANASLDVGFDRFMLDGAEVGGNARQQGFFNVDFGNRRIKETAMTLTPAIGKRYYIKFTSVDRTSSVHIINANDNTESQTVQLGMDLRCSPYIEWKNGLFNVRKLCVTLYGGHCDYFITGDSILYNQSSQVPNPSNRWAYKFKAEKCPNTAISVRGMSNHIEVLLRLTSEILPLKPKCIIDQNYVNSNGIPALRSSFPTYIDVMKSVCAENGIEYIHTMPTMYSDGYTSNRNYIIQNVRTIRFDEATSVDGDVSQGQDQSKFVNDSLHVNTKGSLAMYQRLIDELGL